MAYMAASNKRAAFTEYAKYLKYNKAADRSTANLDAKRVWVPVYGEGNKIENFIAGEITATAGDSVTVKTENGDQKFKKDVCPEMNPPKFEGSEDCAQLSYLNEPSVYQNLKSRYDADLIYTYSGLFLVAVNPYKRIPIYTDPIAELYKGKKKTEVAPHVFAAADVAYRAMLNDRVNQSMLVTGESGAGKTENTKKVIQYMAYIAGRSADGAAGTLESQLLEANPLMEAFGNAKTIKNDNSSRFGKFIKLQFNHGGNVSGATVNSYLLEKSRVIWQAKNERSFHIFYQLIAGSTDEQKKAFELGAADTFKFCSHGQAWKVPSINDVDEFKHTNVAMDVMGLTQTEKDHIFAIISGILHLGNVEFDEAKEQSSIPKKEALGAAARQFGVDANVLELALIKPRIKAGREIVQTHLNKDKAEYSRNALAKAIYGRLFLWIISKINVILAQKSYASFIGILDIAGFEIFEHNSFEQLCINYTNERLQQFFNNHMFKLEQEEYMREKINWTFIDFGLDLQDTIDLIDKKPIGILILLDEESFFPKGSDESFLTKLHTAHTRNAHFKKPKFVKGTFRLAHYAGEVEYEVHNWLDKNKDPLQDDLQICMRGSNKKLVSDVFSEAFGMQSTGEGGSMRSTEPGQVKKEDRRSGNLATTLNMASTTKGASFMTVASQYKEQLTSLMDTLFSTSPHFIRCIIPNLEKAAGKLVPALVLEQLRCNGVLEGIRISRKGFPNRIPYAEFVRRYYILHPDLRSKVAADAKETTRAIIDFLKRDPEQIRFGMTKIFFRTGELGWIEEQREKRIAEMIVVAQAGIRGFLARRVLIRHRSQGQAAIVIQRNLHKYAGWQLSPWRSLWEAARPKLVKRDWPVEIQKLEDSLSGAKKNRDAEKAARTKVENDVLSLIKKLGDLTAALKNQRVDNEEGGKQKSKLERERQELQEKIDALSKELNKLLDESRELGRDKEAALNRIRELEGLLDKERANRRGLETIKSGHENQLAELRDVLNGKNENAKKLDIAKSQLERDLEELKRSLDKEGDAAKGLRIQKDKLQREAADLNSNLDGASTLFKQLEADKKKIEQDLKDLQEDLEREKNERSVKELNRKKLETELEELRNAEKNKGDLANLLENKKKALNAELDDLKADLAKESAARQGLEKAKRKLEIDLDDAKLKLDEATKNRNMLDDLKRKHENELADLKRQLEAANAKIAMLEKAKAALEAQVADLTDRLDKESKDRDIAAKLKKKLEQELEETTAALDDQVKDKGEIEKLKRKLETELKDLLAKVETERKSKTEAENNAAKLAAQLQELKDTTAALQDKIDSLTAAKKKSDNERELAKERLAEESEAKAKAERTIRARENELEELRDALTGMGDKGEYLASMKKKMESELAEARRKLDDEIFLRANAESKRKTLENQIQTVKDNIVESEEQKATIDAERRKLEKELEDIRDRVNDLVNDRYKTERTKKKLEDELAQLKAQIDEAGSKADESSVRRLETELQDVKDKLEAESAAKTAMIRAKKVAESELEGLKEELKRVKEARIKLDKEKREAEDRLAALKERLDEVEASEELKDLIKRQEADLKELRDKFERESSLRKGAEDQKRLLVSELEEFQFRFDQEDKAVGNLGRSKGKLQLELDELEARITAAREDADKANDGRRDREKELKGVRGGPGGATRPHFDTLDLKRLEDQVKDYRYQMDTLTKQSETLDRSNRALEDELYDLKTAIEGGGGKTASAKWRETLEADLKETKEKVATEQAAVDKLDEERHKQILEIEDLKRKSDIENAGRSRADESATGILDQLTRLRKLYDDERKGVSDVDRAKRKAVTDVDELKIKLDNETKARDLAEKDKRTFENDYKELNRKVSADQTKKTEAEKNLIRARNELDDAKKKTDQLEKSREAGDDVVRSLENQLAEAKDQLEEEKRQRFRSESAKRDLDAEIKDLKAELAKNEEARVKLNTTLKASNTKIEDLKKSKAKEVALRDRVDEIRRGLEREVTELKVKTEQAEKEKNNLSNDKRELEERVSSVKEQTDDEEKNVDKADKLVRRLEQELIELRDLANKPESEKDSELRLERENKRLKQRLDEVIDQQAALDAEKRRVEQHISEIREDNRSIEDQVATIRGTLEKEQVLHKELEGKLSIFLNQFKSN